MPPVCIYTYIRKSNVSFSFLLLLLRGSPAICLLLDSQLSFPRLASQLGRVWSRSDSQDSEADWTVVGLGYILFSDLGHTNVLLQPSQHTQTLGEGGGEGERERGKEKEEKERERERGREGETKMPA